MNGNAYQPQLWVNGSIQDLPGGVAADPQFIAVAGNDLYVAGNEYNMSTGSYSGHIWKNGTLQASYSIGKIGGIAATGTDLYIATTENVNGEYVIKVQKNDNASETLLKSSDYISANAIRVINSDVYVTVSKSSTDQIYILKRNNGLFTFPYHAYSNSYVTDAGKAFVATMDENNQGRVWTSSSDPANPTNIELSECNEHCQLPGMYVDNSNNIYVLGRNTTSPNKVYLWKNGTIINDPVAMAGMMPMGVTEKGGKIYVYLRENNSSRDKYTLKQWCLEDDTTVEIFKDATMLPSAICFK